MKNLVGLLCIVALSLIFLPTSYSQISGNPIGGASKTPPSITQPIPPSKPSQSNDNEEQTFNGIAAVGFIMAFPQATFHDTLDKFGYGIDINAAYAPSTFAPLAMGVDFGFMSYGKEKFTQALGGGALSRINVNVETNYNLVTGHAFLRLQPDLKVIMPYIEGFIGFHYLSTSSEVKSQSNNAGDVPFASSTNYDDITLSYGFGGGFGIKLYSDKPKYTDGKRTNLGGALYLDLCARYLFGGKAQYLKPGVSISSGKDAQGNDIPLYSPSTSETDMLTAQIGISYRF